MRYVPRSQIIVGSRQRTRIEPGPLNELKDSILNVGLLSPPVAIYEEGSDQWILIAGERRFKAMCLIIDEGSTFFHNGESVPIAHVPITTLGDYLGETGFFEAELHENVHRVDLDWQDRTRAYAMLHEMRKILNPSQTFTDTAKEIQSKTTEETKRPPTQLKNMSTVVKQSVAIVAHLDKPAVANARNANEAMAKVLKIEEENLRRILAVRRQKRLPVKSSIEVVHGDLFTILPSLADSTFDLICADPPYGIGAAGAGFRARTVHHHNYDDTVDSAKSIARAIFTHGFRLAKPAANLLMFCDIELFDWLKMTSSNMGWMPFRRPLIWQKSESEGMAPWGSKGPRITTEFIFFATKGQRGFHASPTDLFNVRRVSRSERLHAAEKPVELLKTLIEISTLPGDSVLDPCCGSGSTLIAARLCNRTALGIEKDHEYFNTAMANVYAETEPTD